MPLRTRPAAILLTVLLAPVALLAGTPAEAVKRADLDAARELPPAFLDQLKLDQKLQDIGWKLVTANAGFCEKVIPAIGLQMHDMASYEEPGAVRALLGLKGDFAVLTAAAGSPAAKAGLLFNQEVNSISGIEPAGWEAQPQGDWQRTKRLHDLIDGKLAQDGLVTLTLADGRQIEMSPVDACATRFELGGDNKRALAEGSRVILGRRFPGFSYPEDEFAAAIAHELAHNVLQHRAWLDANGRTRKNIRLTEREADRLMPWLLANAGYDPAAATRFMERWGPSHSGGIFRSRTHDGWDERAEFIADEVSRIEALLSQGHQADWRAHFRREVEPLEPS